MQVRIHSSWENALRSQFEMPYFRQLADFVKTEYQQSRCYPFGQHIFNAFDLCPLNRVQVVIIGQDPYHGPGQAHGLCFSVPNDVPHPPSLVNIFRELYSDLKIPYPKSGDLSPWAKQGVLLLNATLTVRAAQAGSHQNRGWETFTDAVIQSVSNKASQVVFMLWGSFAKKKATLVDQTKHHILTSGHPSPLSANRGYWFGNKHFSKCNTYLESKGKSAIDWAL